jgi:hypothetical protein
MEVMVLKSWIILIIAVFLFLLPMSSFAAGNPQQNPSNSFNQMDMATRYKVFFSKINDNQKRLIKMISTKYGNQMKGVLADLAARHKEFSIKWGVKGSDPDELMGLASEIGTLQGLYKQLELQQMVELRKHFGPKTVKWLITGSQ